MTRRASAAGMSAAAFVPSDIFLPAKILGDMLREALPPKICRKMRVSVDLPASALPINKKNLLSLLCPRRQ